MGDQMRDANFSLTKAKYSAGDFSYAFLFFSFFFFFFLFFSFFFPFFFSFLFLSGGLELLVLRGSEE